MPNDLDEGRSTMSGCNVLFDALKVCHKPMQLKELLEIVLESLVNHPTMQVERRGAIMLRGSKDELILVAESGFAEGRKPFCERVSLDRCACGRAVLESKTIFELCDGDTEFYKLGPGEGRKHFVLPLTDGENLIGAAPIFVKEGYEPKSEDFKLLEGLSMILSGIVSRKLAEEAIMIKQLELMESKTDVIQKLGVASEYRDNETGMHILRMTHYASAIAKAFGLPGEEREELIIAAPMHDVGKIGIPDKILSKPGKLDEDEYEVMKEHTLIGKHILKGDDALLLSAQTVAESHHERWDGAGYPHGLKGEEIPISGRICAIADVFDALTSKRPYKEPWPVEKAINLIKEEAGKSFDPALVEAFTHALPEILRLRELYRDEIIDPNEKLSLPPLKKSENVWIPWDDSLSVGIDTIDEHHMYLIDLVNDLYGVVAEQKGSIEVGRLLRSLEQYASVHFRDEEMMMRQYDYDRLDKQILQHANFAAQIAEFWSELKARPLTLGQETVLFLRDWLVNHIKKEDARLIELTGRAG